MKKLRNLVPNFLLILCSALVFFFLIEILLRLIPQSLLSDVFEDFRNKYIYQNNEKLGYRLNPNLKTGFEGHLLVTNSRGLRDKEYNIEEKPDLRILALGDSFTFGEGVEAKNTYVKVLEGVMRNRYPDKKIEVINTGVPGYGNDQEFIFLKSEGGFYKPDLVIVGFYIGNDFLDNEIGGVKRRRVKENGFLYDIHIESRIDDELKEKYLDKLLCKADRYLKEKSYAYFLIKSRTDNLLWKWGLKKIYNQYTMLDIENFPYFKKEMSQEYQRGFENTINIIKEMRKEATRLGAQIIVVLIPAGFQVYESLFESLLEEYYLDKKDYNALRLNSIIMKRLESEGIPALDLLPVFRKKGEKDLYAWGHWTSKAHRIAGEKIYMFMEKSGLIF